MPIPSKRKQKRSGANLSHSSWSNNFDEKFDHIYSIVDSAITAALISGVDLDCLQSVLSYAFLNVASRARSLSAEFDTWVSDPDLVWEPVIGAVHRYLENFDGSIEAAYEINELEYLREDCKIKFRRLSEIQEHKQKKIAFALICWLLHSLAVHDFELLIVESAFLIQWFKVGVLLDTSSERDYLIVRHNIAAIAEIYSVEL